jgi:hypothetical protein
LCTLVLGAAQQLLEQNQTESEVLAFIEKNLCGRLGALNGTCTQYMETEGREIIYELSMKIVSLSLSKFQITFINLINFLGTISRVS